MRSVVPAILPCDPLFVYVLQCLVRSCMDHRAESHRVCSAASVTSKYGQQIWLHARANLHSSHTRRSVCLVQSRMPATLMSAARASSWCSCIAHTQASEGHTSTRVSCIQHSMFLVSCLQFLVVLRFLFQHPLSALTYGLKWPLLFTLHWRVCKNGMQEWVARQWSYMIQNVMNDTRRHIWIENLTSCRFTLHSFHEISYVEVTMASAVKIWWERP